MILISLPFPLAFHISTRPSRIHRPYPGFPVLVLQPIVVEKGTTSTIQSMYVRPLSPVCAIFVKKMHDEKRVLVYLTQVNSSFNKPFIYNISKPSKLII